MKRMKTVALLTKLSDRDSRTEWQKKGSLDTHARAILRVREILSMDTETGFLPEVDARIRAQFKELIPGNLETVEGW
jgi:trimethylamine:corrinoid methyltransferase-like protein